MGTVTRPHPTAAGVRTTDRHADAKVQKALQVLTMHALSVIVAAVALFAPAVQAVAPMRTVKVCKDVRCGTWGQPCCATGEPCDSFGRIKLGCQVGLAHVPVMGSAGPCLHICGAACASTVSRCASGKSLTASWQRAADLLSLFLPRGLVAEQGVPHTPNIQGRGSRKRCRPCGSRSGPACGAPEALCAVAIGGSVHMCAVLALVPRSSATRDDALPFRPRSARSDVSGVQALSVSQRRTARRVALVSKTTPQALRVAPVRCSACLARMITSTREHVAL